MTPKNLRRAPALLLAMCLFAEFVPAAEVAFAPGQKFATSHVVVKFKASVATAQGARADQLAGLLGKLKLPAGAALKETAWSLGRAQADAHTPAGSDFMYLELPPGLSVNDCLNRLKKVPDLEYAEPDGIGRGAGEMIPTDFDFDFQWHHKNPDKPSASIHTPEAWEIATGSSSITVAVIDTGLNTSLAEFSGRLVNGYNFVSSSTNVTDDHGHGTMVSSTLCANANNGLGGAGVDWNCKLMPIKALDQNNYGLYSWWAQAINFAVAHGVKVINMSSGGTGSSTTLTTAINNAIAAGVIFVTITHNDGVGVITYPGNLPACISVGATGRDDVRWSSSNFGPQIDLVAPGVDIYGIGNSGGIEVWHGTSFAAPQVAGVAAVICGLRPNLKQGQIETLLRAGADDQVGDLLDTFGFDIYYGAGRLNAYNSLQLAQTKIDRIEIRNGQLVLSWPAPSNASSHLPFVVQFRALSATNWTQIAAPESIVYSTGRATWTSENPERGFYQIAIR